MANDKRDIQMLISKAVGHVSFQLNRSIQGLSRRLQTAEKRLEHEEHLDTTKISREMAAIKDTLESLKTDISYLKQCDNACLERLTLLGRSIDHQSKQIDNLIATSSKPTDY